MALARKKSKAGILHKPVAAWYHTFAASQRPGSMDAFKLPSLIQGVKVPAPFQRPAPHPEAVLL